MKIKQLLLSALTIMLFVTSCTKEEIVIQPKSLAVNESQIKTMSTTSETISSPKAYVFVEPFSKYSMVSSYLRSVPKSSQFSLPFIGWFGVNGMAWKYNFINYIDMPHWYDGRLPSLIETEIPQSSGGVDSYGNPITMYNFKTVKIPKNTVVGVAWISILIPVSEMGNDTKRQRTVFTYEKIGNSTVTNGSISGWTYTMDNVIYSTTFNYQGTKIRKGIYRLYTTTALKVNLTATKDYYLKGNSVVNGN